MTVKGLKARIRKFISGGDNSLTKEIYRAYINRYEDTLLYRATAS